MSRRHFDRIKRDKRSKILSEELNYEFIFPLLHEVEEMNEFMISKPECSIRRRAVIRSTMSCIDGILYFLKVSCYKAYYSRIKPFLDRWDKEEGLPLPKEGFYGRLDDDVLFLLIEGSLGIDNDGKLQYRDTYPPALGNVKFTFNSWCQLYGLEPVDFGQKGWKCFQDFVEIRNRVTHPHALSEFALSDDEMKQADAAFDWFQDQILYLLEGAEMTSDFHSLKELVRELPKDHQADLLRRVGKLKKEAGIKPY